MPSAENGLPSHAPIAVAPKSNFHSNIIKLSVEVSQDRTAYSLIEGFYTDSIW